MHHNASSYFGTPAASQADREVAAAFEGTGVDPQGTASYCTCAAVFRECEPEVKSKNGDRPQVTKGACSILQPN